MPKKKSKQSQSNQQEIVELKSASPSQLEQASSSSDAVDKKIEIIELKPASSSQLEEVPNSSDAVDQKTEIIELKSASSSQSEPTTEKQQVKSTTDNQKTDKTSKPKPAIKLKKFQKKESSPPPYKNLETATNQNGETFVVGEKIKINTCNFGEYTVEIKFLYVRGASRALKDCRW